MGKKKKKMEVYTGAFLREDALFNRLILYGVVVYLVLVFYLSLVPVSSPRPEVIPRVERPAKLALAELKVISPDEIPVEIVEGIGEGIGEGEGEGSGGPRKEPGARGVLGVLTGLGVGAKGDAVEDILGTKGLSRDLDNILAGLDGLQKGGISTSHVARKSGASSSGGIDDLMGDVFVGYGDARLSKKGGGSISSTLPLGGGRTLSARTLDEINQVVQERIGGIEYCYNSELKVKPDLKGKITVSFLIRSDGVVDNCQVLSSTLENPSLENCIRRAISRWRFVAKEDVGDVEVVYPLVFFPKL